MELAAFGFTMQTIPPGAWLGLSAGGWVCAGVLALLFHHYVVRIRRAGSWLWRGALLVDVDAAGEFALQHPRVAVNIPLQDLARRAHELGGNNKPLVIFANSWRRGAQALHELRGIGYSEVMNAAGLRTKEKLSAEASRAAEAR